MTSEKPTRRSLVFCFGPESLDPSEPARPDIFLAHKVQSSILKICEDLGGFIEANDFLTDEPWEEDGEIFEEAAEEREGAVIIVVRFPYEASADRACRLVVETWGKTVSIYDPDADSESDDWRLDYGEGGEA